MLLPGGLAVAFLGSHPGHIKLWALSRRSRCMSKPRGEAAAQHTAREISDQISVVLNEMDALLSSPRLPCSLCHADTHVPSANGEGHDQKGAVVGE